MAQEKVTAVNMIMKSIGRKDAKEAYAKVRFQLTQKIIEAWEWPEVPEQISEWTPEINELRCHFIEVTPNNSELHSHKLRIEAATIGDFQIQRKKKKEGKNSRKAQKTITFVLCTVKFHLATALATLESYKVNANKNAEMLICYDLPAEQIEMSEGPKATEEQRQAVLDMAAGEGNKPAPTHAEKVAAKRKESERLAEIRKRINKPGQAVQ